MSSRIAGNNRLGLGSSKIEVLSKISKKIKGKTKIFWFWPLAWPRRAREAQTIWKVWDGGRCTARSLVLARSLALALSALPFLFPAGVVIPTLTRLNRRPWSQSVWPSVCLPLGFFRIGWAPWDSLVLPSIRWDSLAELKAATQVQFNATQAQLSCNSGPSKGHSELHVATQVHLMSCSWVALSCMRILSQMSCAELQPPGACTWRVRGCPPLKLPPEASQAKWIATDGAERALSVVCSL